MAKTKAVQIRLSETRHASLQAVAGTGSVADVVRRALDAYLTEPCPKCGGSGLMPKRGVS